MKKKNHREVAKIVFPCKCFVCEKYFDKIIHHYKDGNSNNNNEDNLIKVCSKCHHLIHFGSRKKGNPEIFARAGSLRKFLLKKRKNLLPSPEEDLTIKAIQPIHL